jgi:nucleotidyltransferase AbiEii toxin of type IV toxin-antitoxin system
MKNALINIEKWVQQDIEKPSKAFREAIHSILYAITNSDYLLRNMIIKGGILLAIRYQSTRFTKDIDFSTSESYTEKKKQELIKELEQSLTDTVDILGYDLDCRVQSCKIQTANQPEPTFPSLKIKIGYAYIGTREHKRLVKNNASSVIDIDFNYNESLPHIEEIQISKGKTILAYSLNDLIAEKFSGYPSTERSKPHPTTGHLRFALLISKH